MGEPCSLRGDRRAPAGIVLQRCLAALLGHAGEPRGRERALMEQALVELAAAEEERRQYAEYLESWRVRGWKPMAREPAIPPMWQCLRCSVLAFDPEVHERWHSTIGDPLPY